ncbi:MAG: hypothetical protein JW801_16730 [Bacteroidales bacterium]|nr:hypothetical protein [Bacteroidales bacterium]
MRLTVTFALLLLSLVAFTRQDPGIQKLEFRIDTFSYTWPDDAVLHNNQKALPFFFDDQQEIVEVELWLKNQAYEFSLLPSSDYSILDSLLYTGNSYRFKVQFHNLNFQDFLKFSFRSVNDSIAKLIDIPLQAYTRTSASLHLKDPTLFIGEEIVFEVLSNNPENIITTNEWQTTPKFDYLLKLENSRLFLHLVPNTLGSGELLIPIKTRKPSMNRKKQLIYSTEPIQQIFYVKNSRLQFLNLNPTEITLSESSKTEGIEIQLDDSRMLAMEKTYRIENQEEKGGALIAELFTRRRLANNKVLCLVRPYNYHAKSEGYLYIKDGDEARFLTNLNVSHTTTITGISILRQGGQWKKSNVVYPGELIELQIEGRSLHRAKFRFEDLTDLTSDTLTHSDTRVNFTLQVPADIRKKELQIYNHQEPTDQVLKVAEYQRPREFDYLYLNYGDIGRRVSGIRGPILFQKTIQDVVFTFNDDAVDGKDEFYGKQYFDIDVRVTGKRNELIEMRTIKNVAVCPSKNSPRYEYYSSHDCNTESLSLNKYLSRKTYDLDEWSKISLTIKNDESKYSEEGYLKEVDIILKRNYAFDIEVSFPAGLITIARQDDGEIGFGSLSGISMAMIAQFSFYHPEKIATYRPYKIGAGFLAFNAFNFSDNVDDRDVGIVVLGSVYPTKRDVKLSFPLYVGGGYFLKDQKWFFLIGPGIRVRL